MACATLFFATSAHAQPEQRAYKIEAAFLYNFFNYITWPGHANTEDMHAATICLTPRDPLRPYLEYIQDKRQTERSLRLRDLSETSDISGCQIYFLRNDATVDTARLAKEAADHGVLLVSTSDDFLTRGGFVELTQENDHLSLAIDYTKLKQAGFQVSSRLLSLAQQVK